MLQILVLLFILANQQCLCLGADYYWREYTGTVPEDAIKAGEDIDGKDIYIGQAYVKNEGLIVSQIVPGVREVQTPIKGSRKINNYIKILCGIQQNFYWEPANSTHLHLSTIGKHTVIGGHEDGGGLLNIGRINHEGELKIGKILSFRPQDAVMYYSHNDKELVIKSYEVLFFNRNAIDVRINPK